MSQNKEEIKNKIIYRSSYRGTKEMDILMTNFVKTIVNDFDIDQLKLLDEFVNLDDEVLISIKKNRESKTEIDIKFNFIIKKFQSFQ
tara:strand:+ start:763 stop:1023 length:261 start_codon:yes stop_codon:yes gene_type:complete